MGAIVIDPRSPGTAEVGREGVFRTVDCGQKWNAVNSGLGRGRWVGNLTLDLKYAGAPTYSAALARLTGELIERPTAILSRRHRFHLPSPSARGDLPGRMPRAPRGP